MNANEKLEILGFAAQYDLSCCGRSINKKEHFRAGIYPSIMSNGQVCPIMKTLYTNKCKNDCVYCENRVSSDKVKRISFKPQELANLFMKIYRSSEVFGLFLSSGVCNNSDSTMTEMIETAEILRYRYHFKGYLHLKVLPYTSSHLIAKASQLATRLSINVEAPTPQQLEKLCPGKDMYNGILSPIDTIQKYTHFKKDHLKATTQFVVGAGQEKDQEILKTMFWLKNKKDIFRTYFSAFLPLNGTSSPQNMRQTFTREHRLYQSEFLGRQYGFNYQDIFFEKDGNLSSAIDPKLNYALHKPEKFPIEVNQASQNDLLKIPGIGPNIAKKIVQIRKAYRFNYLEELKRLRVDIKRAAPFILLNGRKQGSVKNLIIAEQLALI